MARITWSRDRGSKRGMVGSLELFRISGDTLHCELPGFDFHPWQREGEEELQRLAEDVLAEFLAELNADPSAPDTR